MHVVQAFDCERAGTHQSIIWPGDGRDKMPHAKSRNRKLHNYDIFVSIDSGPYLNRFTDTYGSYTSKVPCCERMRR